MADAAASLSGALSMKLALQLVQTMNLTASTYTDTVCSLTNGSSFDFIIVGGGTAGSVLANRLSENNDVNVLLLEAGGYPPLESKFPGTFMLLKESAYDFNYYSVDDHYTMQNMITKTCALTQGKMLGGSSSNHHMMYTRGDPSDYEVWAERANDTAWNVTNIQQYFMKQEKLTDEEILNSEYACLHGTDGNIKLRRQTHPIFEKIFSAFEEAGNSIVLDSTSLKSNIGYTTPLFAIDDGVRQSSALGYLAPAKSRKNLCVSLFTTATKILTKNNVAIGVQVTTSSNETYVLYADKEVIVSAGTINSPKLLMLSGIGPREHLESFGIDVVADLPVGQNFMDQPGSPIIILTDEKIEAPSVSNSDIFPAPSFSGNVALNCSTKPSYQTINLVFPAGTTGLLDLCSQMFSYTNEICQKFYEASKTKSTIFSLVGLTLPESTGNVSLASANANDAPIVHTGMFSNPADLHLMGQAFLDHIKVLNTTYFKSVNAEILDLGLCKDTASDVEFWECYTVDMSTTMWHFGGTCAIGLVVDSDLRVKGIKSLRVADASAMPALVTGKTAAAVGMLAERAADLIRIEHNIA